MSEQAAPSIKEIRGALTVTLPVSLLQRLQPLAIQRRRSEFVEQAIAAALDKTEQDQDQDREREPAGAEP
jgi:metal-responsive CopG/Arc/MetJ family transcriptional regulator